VEVGAVVVADDEPFAAVHADLVAAAQIRQTAVLRGAQKAGAGVWRPGLAANNVGEPGGWPAVLDVFQELGLCLPKGRRVDGAAAIFAAQADLEGVDLAHGVLTHWCLPPAGCPSGRAHRTA